MTATLPPSSRMSCFLSERLFIHPSGPPWKARRFGARSRQSPWGRVPPERGATMTARRRTLGKVQSTTVVVGGMHLHHLVLGILLLLGVGYLWLAQVGTGIGRSLDWPSRLTALLYGVGAAFTLD